MSEVRLPSTSPGIRGPVVFFGRFKVTPHYRAIFTGSSRDQKVLVSKEEGVTDSSSSPRLDSKQPCHPSVPCLVSEGSSARRRHAHGSGPGGAGEPGAVSARGAKWGCTRPPPPGFPRCAHGTRQGARRVRSAEAAPFCSPVMLCF